MAWTAWLTWMAWMARCDEGRDGIDALDDATHPQASPGVSRAFCTGQRSGCFQLIHVPAPRRWVSQCVHHSSLFLSDLFSPRPKQALDRGTLAPFHLSSRVRLRLPFHYLFPGTGFGISPPYDSHRKLFTGFIVASIVAVLSQPALVAEWLETWTSFGAVMFLRPGRLSTFSPLLFMFGQLRPADLVSRWRDQ